MENPDNRFSRLLRAVDVLERSSADPSISEVAYDSRRVIPGVAFVAMQGGTTDGNRYVEDVLRQGAAAIITDSAATWSALRAEHPNAAVAWVRHGRRALAQLSANFYRHPEQRLSLSGVTGTNGKTTTTYLLESMLRTAGRKCVLVGTIEYHVAGKILPSAHTTPESRDLFELLAEGISVGAAEAVLEVSSHALEQERVWGLPWDIAVFTNLTQDHLDYHGDMESYFQAKAKMFRGIGTVPPRIAAIHCTDNYGQRMAEIARSSGSDVVTYGLENGDFRATNVELGAQSTRFHMRTPAGEIDLHTRLAGPVNVQNLLAASAAAMARGLSIEEIARGVEAIDHVPGRFQAVDCGQPFTVVVDYAHTEDALRNVTRLARLLAAPRKGRVITVFGCGGDRDRGKRSKMGRAAGDGSDFVVVTSDNPRSEDPMKILAEIVPGIITSGTRYSVESDRAEAIRLAIADARENDVIVIAGKGHEKVQMVGDRTIPFDDADVARAVLSETWSNNRASM